MPPLASSVTRYMFYAYVLAGKSRREDRTFHRQRILDMNSITRTDHGRQSCLAGIAYYFSSLFSQF